MVPKISVISITFRSVNLAAEAMFSVVNSKPMEAANVFKNNSMQQVTAKATTKKKTT